MCAALGTSSARCAHRSQGASSVRGAWRPQALGVALSANGGKEPHRIRCVVLATLRPLWKFREQLEADPPIAQEPTPAGDPERVEFDVERTAAAAYEAVPSPTRWRDLPELLREEWRARTSAAVDAGFGR